MFGWFSRKKDETGYKPSPQLVKQFIDSEAELRKLHGELSLFVKPSLYQVGNDRLLGVAGWAFLDGQPAILPRGLDVLVVACEADGGEMAQLGRDPAAVLELLGDRIAAHEEPCPHMSVSVDEGDKPDLLDKIRALPEHRP